VNGRTDWVRAETPPAAATLAAAGVPALLAPLLARRIGLEAMDSFAACRTYNILAGEGRNVVLALIIAPPAPG